MTAGRISVAAFDDALLMFGGGRIRSSSDSPLEEAVSSEPVSEPKFPAGWENAGNFVDCGLNDASKGAKKGAKSVAHGPIPYAAEQGIFCTLAGN